MENDDLIHLFERSRRARRRKLNQRFKERDRYKPRLHYPLQMRATCSHTCISGFTEHA